MYDDNDHDDEYKNSRELFCDLTNYKGYQKLKKGTFKYISKTDYH